jgi:hypothetical protein
VGAACKLDYMLSPFDRIRGMRGLVEWVGKADGFPGDIGAQAMLRSWFENA